MSTLSSSFHLKGINSDREALIFFSCYFNQEKKRFRYSTGEKIHPDHWDKKTGQPKLRGNKDPHASVITAQINRYRDFFYEIQARCKMYDEDFTSMMLRSEFDKHFKKARVAKNGFFDAFDSFMEYKDKLGDWSKGTYVRYNNIKMILQDFQKDRKYKLTFNSINMRFLAEFTDYCIKEKGHINNTFSRNIGLIKAFMRWALENGYTYKDDFRKFRKKKVTPTNQIALTIEDLKTLMQKDFKTKRLEKVRDVFVFACVTGMRFGEMKLINKENIIGQEIHLKEKKDSEKDVRIIPLNDLALYILRKYDYLLPLISNHKYNGYIKEVFDLAGYNWEVEKVYVKGKENIRETLSYSDRVSSHTARRTFITMMKRKGVSDKLIASITGHRDMKTLNQYYQVDDDSKREAVSNVFALDFQPLKKVD